MPRAENVARRYDRSYARAFRVADHGLAMSLDRLFANYGVVDPVRHRDSERLPIALRVLEYPTLEGKVVLDYGCGSAKAAVVFAQAGARVFGFDVSPNAIHTGRRRAAINDVGDRVHLSVMSGNRLAYPDDSFDYVFGYEILYYIGGLDFGREVLRVLKPGGRAVFCEAFDGNAPLRWARGVLRRVTGTVNRTGGRALTLDRIRGAFGPEADVATYPVNLFAIAKRFFAGAGVMSRHVVMGLKRLDRWCLGRYPRLRRLCGEIVVVVTK